MPYSTVHIHFRGKNPKILPKKVQHYDMTQRRNKSLKKSSCLCVALRGRMGREERNGTREGRKGRKEGRRGRTDGLTEGRDFSSALTGTAVGFSLKHNQIKNLISLREESRKAGWLIL